MKRLTTSCGWLFFDSPSASASRASFGSSPSREQKDSKGIYFSDRDWKSHKSPLIGGDLGEVGGPRSCGEVVCYLPLRSSPSLAGQTTFRMIKNPLGFTVSPFNKGEQFVLLFLSSCPKDWGFLVSNILNTLRMTYT